MRNLFNEMSREPYEDDPDKLDRLEFISKGLEGILDKKLTNQSAILLYSRGGALKDNEVIDLKEFDDLANPEVDYINNTVSACLRHLGFDTIYKDRLRQVLDDYDATDFKDRDEAMTAIMEAISETNSFFRKTKNDNNDSSYFSLQPDIMMKEITNTYEELANPSNMLRTGMIGFNELLGGGIFLGKGYIIFGLPAEGKSAFLLNLCIQIKKYNPNYITKDPTKKPCVVYISQENSKVETIERLYAVSTSSDDFISHKPDIIYQQMTKWGKMTITDESPIDIIIIYREPFTNDTSYFDEVVDDLADDGYEVIFIGHDYVQRIHCQDKSARGDTRLELGFVTNEEVTFAKHRNIAFMTLGQLNRDATGKIDEGKIKNKVDLVRMIGRSNIAESTLMLNNMDGAFVIAKEYCIEEGRYYYGIQRLKKRFKASDRSYIYQPCYPDCAIRLIEDVGGNPQFKQTMAPPQNNMTIGAEGPIRTSPMQLNKVKNLDVDIPMDNSLESIDDILVAKRQLVGANQYTPVMISQPMYMQPRVQEKKKLIDPPFKIVV